MKIKDCKLNDFQSCSLETNIVNVAKLLKNKKEKYVILTDKGKPVGVISTKDICDRIVADKKDPEKIMAKEIMSSPIISKDVNESLIQAYLELVKNDLVSCPITKEGKLMGILDLREIMNVLSKNIKK